MIEPGQKIVLASNNAKKVAELRDILESHGIALLGLADFPAAPVPEEDADTFEGNALIKARAAAMHTGLPALADDSGLVVDCLNGEPGVRSARYAGEEADDDANNALLLRNLTGVPAEGRQARFVSVIALAFPDGRSLTFRGETSGVITERPRGRNGFGYDPLFLSDDLGVTFAEAAAVDKNRISHRARALRKFVSGLEAGR